MTTPHNVAALDQIAAALEPVLARFVKTAELLIAEYGPEQGGAHLGALLSADYSHATVSALASWALIRLAEAGYSSPSLPTPTRGE